MTLSAELFPCFLWRAVPWARGKAAALVPPHSPRPDQAGHLHADKPAGSSAELLSDFAESLIVCLLGFLLLWKTR